MDSLDRKPHVVCVPCPVQSHIKSLLKLAKLLHFRGFHITFVNTEYNHNRFLRSLGPNSLDVLPDFVFETIPDGLPPSDADATQDLSSLSHNMARDVMLTPFCDLLRKQNERASTSTSTSCSNIIPPVSCILSDVFSPFTVLAAEEFGIPAVLFVTVSACAIMASIQYPSLFEKGLVPLKGD